MTWQRFNGLQRGVSPELATSPSEVGFALQANVSVFSPPPLVHALSLPSHSAGTGATMNSYAESSSSVLGASTSTRGRQLQVAPKPVPALDLPALQTASRVVQDELNKDTQSVPDLNDLLTVRTLPLLCQRPQCSEHTSSSGPPFVCVVQRVPRRPSRPLPEEEACQYTRGAVPILQQCVHLRTSCALMFILSQPPMSRHTWVSCPKSSVYG